MFATSVTRSLLCVAITLIALASLTPSALADSVNWTDVVTFNQVPTTDGAGQLVGRITIPGVNPIRNLPNGFSVSDLQLVYTIAEADRGKKVTVTYTLLRPFNAPAGPYAIQSVLQGTINLPNIEKAQVQATLRTELAFAGAVAIANAGPFPFNGGAPGFADNATKNFNFNGGADALIQTFSVVFDFTNVPAGAFGGVITITLPGSAESLIDQTPEPATMLLLGTGLVGVAIKTRKRLRNHENGK